MSKNKYLGFSLLMLLLNACNNTLPVNQTTPNIQVSKSPDATKIVTSVNPVITPTPVNSEISPSPSFPVNIIPPTGQTGSTGDNSVRSTFSGKVYDSNTVAIEGAKVSARSIDPQIDWVGEDFVTVDGSYVFRNAPVGVKIAITVTKDGWTKREREEIVFSNLQGNPTLNVFNFNDNYAIQDEPEVTSIKVNGKQFFNSVANSSFINGVASPDIYTTINQLTTSTYTPSLTGVDNDKLDIEMTFSEPVRRDDVENYFKIYSQQFVRDGLTKAFSIDKNLAGSNFTWADDDKSVVFKTNKAILANKDGDEARYSIEFTQPFRDKTDKPSLSHKYIRFSPTQINNFAVFSVKNDNLAPELLSIQAMNGDTSADIIKLNFNKPMEVINQSSAASSLADPFAPLDTSRQLYAYSTNNQNGNNSTVLGYKDSEGNFIVSFVIGKLLATDIKDFVKNQNIKLSALGSAIDIFPNIPTQYAGNDTFGKRLRSSKVNGNTVLIELTPQAFSKGDRILVAASSNINASYSFANLNHDLNLPSNSKFASIQDPAGNLIDIGSLSTDSLINVNNHQRVDTVD